MSVRFTRPFASVPRLQSSRSRVLIAIYCTAIITSWESIIICSKDARTLCGLLSPGWSRKNLSKRYEVLSSSEKRDTFVLLGHYCQVLCYYWRYCPHFVSIHSFEGCGIPVWSLFKLHMRLPFRTLSNNRDCNCSWHTRRKRAYVPSNLFHWCRGQFESLYAYCICVVSFLGNDGGSSFAHLGLYYELNEAWGNGDSLACLPLSSAFWLIPELKAYCYIYPHDRIVVRLCQRSSCLGLPTGPLPYCNSSAWFFFLFSSQDMLAIHGYVEVRWSRLWLGEKYCRISAEYCIHYSYYSLPIASLKLSILLLIVCRAHLLGLLYKKMHIAQSHVTENECQVMHALELRPTIIGGFEL